MSELYIQANNGSAFETYFDALANHIASFLAVDSSVRLECDTTLGFSIPAQLWTDVVEALAVGLRVVFYEVSTQSPLSIPCSQALVELFVHQIWSPVSDTRGIIHVSLPLPLDSHTITPAQTIVWESIFGDQGYFQTYRSHVILAGASYLAPDGDYKPCQFYLGKEGKVTKKSKTVKSDLKAHTVHPARKVLRIYSGSEIFYRALDASIDDFTGLAYLFPALSVQAEDKSSLDARLVVTHPICEDVLIPTSVDEHDPAIRAALWLFNATDHGLALRGSIRIRPSHGLIYEFLRTVLVSLNSFNKREISDDFGPLPTTLGIVRLLNACLLCLNPYMLFLDSARVATFHGDAFKLVHALHRIVRPLTCPVSISESLRALRSNFIPYAGHEDAYAGMTLCCCVDFIGLPIDPHIEFNPIQVGGVKYSWSPLDINFFEPDHVNEIAVIKASPTPGEPLAYLRHLHSQVNLINQLGVATSSLLQFSPALSYDSNRIPISAKYLLGCPSKNVQVTEFLNNFSWELKDLDNYSNQSIIYHEGMLHLMVLSENIQDFLVFTTTAQSLPEHKIAGDLDLVRLSLLEAYATYSEFNTGTIDLHNETDDKDKKFPTHIPGPTETSNGGTYFLFCSAQLAIGDLSEGEVALDVFTKVPGLERVVDYVSRCIHMPIIHDPTLLTSARLFLLGFLRGKTNVNSEYLALAQANLRDSHNVEKAVTPAGALLMELSKKGGFGFGALLGPLLGEGAKAITGLLGVPEVGDAIAGVANIAGSLLPF